ncbi:hypothetical protein TSUD_222250 [Trifolium subterraneum]|uniref:Uncharacterized protein n=1 Tax=Trifolium subterraneum TaxID=3900 RepID=A0A2Z6M3S9_TRISU|nr:hypothetical protein TSUD_222250 [Trifolium subterraneum]
MDSLDDLPRRRRRSFKERLGFIGFGCCGTTWGFRSSSSSAQLSQNIQQQSPDMDIDTGPGQDPNMCLGLSLTAPTSSGSGSSSMNLAAALAAERQLRGAGQTGETVVGVGRMPGTPWRVSLMRLLEETENGDTVAVVSKVAEDKVCSVAGSKQALISLSDKKDLAFVGNGLQELGSGGTASALESAGVVVTKVEQLTQFPEMVSVLAV